MYSILVSVQIVSIVLIMLILYYLFRRTNTDLQRTLIFICAGLLINQTGYLFEMLSTTQDAAIVSVKFAYLGKMTVLLFVFIYEMAFCGIRLPKRITYPLSAVHYFIVALVWTCNYHDLYYSEIGYTQEGLFPHLVLQHGIFYNLFLLLTFGYLIAMFAVCTIRLIKFKDKVTRRKICFLLTIPIISMIGLMLWSSGITNGYDPTAAGYLLQTVLMTYALFRYDIVSPLDYARETLVENFREPIVILNVSGDIIYMNAIFKKIWYKHTTISLKHELGNIIEAQTQGREYKFEEHVYQIKRSFVEQQQNFVCDIYVLNDITEIYKTQKKLEEAREEANNANRAKSDFLANMSHEIRTPINTVLGLNTMILRESSENEIKSYALNVQSAAQGLLGIINDILDFSKIESGKMEIIPVEYELPNLVNDLTNMIKDRAEGKNLYFKIEVDESIPVELFGDDVRLRQVLINLLTNAVKYTHEGGVILCISGHCTGDKAKLKFEVKDTGIGIKEEHISSLFESFTRIEEKRNRHIEGTGLGINIVTNFLKLMGSKLQVSSVYGKGSNFYFEIEQGIVDATPVGDIQARITNMASEYKYEARFAIPEVTLLVVDDNGMNRLVFKQLLKELKCRIDEADSGYKCLELVKENTYDIIFMDHMMPDMNGIETLKHMKAFGDYPNKDTPVIILTANAISGAKEEYLEAGFDDYMSKPIDADKLEKLIGDIIDDSLKMPVEEEDSEREKAATGSNTSSTEDYPFVDGIDWDYALLKLKAKDLVMDMIKDFSTVAKKDIEVLKGMYVNISEGKLDDYAIKVHAMKTNAAMIGALQVSGLAKYLEYAAKDGDEDTINRLMPVFEKQWGLLKTNIDEAFGFGEFNSDISTEKIDTVMLLDYLEMLEEAMSTFDLDEADRMVEELQKYYFEGEQKDILENLIIAVHDLDSDKCNELINLWRNSL